MWQGGMYGREACMHGRVKGVHGRGHVWRGGHAWQGECVAIGCMAGGACTVGGMCDRGVCVCGMQERWPLKQAIGILLECILVFHTCVQNNICGIGRFDQAKSQYHMCYIILPMCCK